MKSKRKQVRPRRILLDCTTAEPQVIKDTGNDTLDVSFALEMRWDAELIHLYEGKRMRLMYNETRFHRRFAGSYTKGDYEVVYPSFTIKLRMSKKGVEILDVSETTE